MSRPKESLHTGRIGTRALVLSAVMMPLALGGCVTSIPPVEVTRFHADPVPTNGTINIIAANLADSDSLEFRTTASAVSAALTRVGFTVLDTGAPGSAYFAVVSVKRETYLPGDKRSPVSVGGGVSAGSFGSGVGLGVSIDLSGKPKGVIWTEMRVQVRRANDRATLWEGRAETAAKVGSPAAQPGMAVGKLADALFKGYPGVSGETITVK